MFDPKSNLLLPYLISYRIRKNLSTISHVFPICVISQGEFVRLYSMGGSIVVGTGVADPPKIINAIGFHRNKLKNPSLEIVIF